MSISFAQQLISAYAQGAFPMAETADDDQFYWVQPEQRMLIPLDERFHLPRSLKKSLRKSEYTASFTDSFTTIIDACAETLSQQTHHLVPRQDTWINASIREGFIDLHRMGFAHAVGVYDRQNTLVGGLYGLALGGAFFGESMFSYRSGASKIALVYLVQQLRKANFALLDCQFSNPHLEQFGAFTIDNQDYIQRLRQALAQSTQPFGDPDRTPDTSSGK